MQRKVVVRLGAAATTTTCARVLAPGETLAAESMNINGASAWRPRSFRHAAGLCRLDSSFHGAVLAQRRHQSAMADKRFHCSICKKAFRLEMAAKVHLQQAHNGEGSVETGSGPGQPDGAASTGSVGVPPPNAPPQGPTIIEDAPKAEERPLRRRSKPTPKPLHEPHRDVPADVMAEMLGVWDGVGVKRLEGRFVHSSMVMKVFAARPDAGAEPLYDPVVPEGENPFADAATAVTKGAGGGSILAEEHNIYDINLGDAFAVATDEYYGPFRVARCENPYARAGTTGSMPRMSPVTAAATASQQQQQQAAAAGEEEPQTAPVTPYGQLPVFGQAPSAPQTAAPAASPAQGASIPGVVASPFASSVADSPFAQRVESPFVASPFAAATAAASGAADASAAPSPFTGMGGTESPFMAAGEASPFTASPFVQDGSGTFGSFSAPEEFPPYEAVDAFGVPSTPAEADPPVQHECATCGKMFSSHDGLRMHSKAKHGIEIPREETGGKKRVVPELPAYIPSPVDLSMTTPFGKKSSETAWSETEIVPHAISMSNITVTGKVLAVSRLDRNTVQMTIFVASDPREDSETLTIRWTKGDIPGAIARDDTVFVCGTLRLLPIYEPANDSFYSTPIVVVSSPTGIVQRIS